MTANVTVSCGRSESTMGAGFHVPPPENSDVKHDLTHSYVEVFTDVSSAALLQLKKLCLGAWWKVGGRGMWVKGGGWMGDGVVCFDEMRAVRATAYVLRFMRLEEENPMIRPCDEDMQHAFKWMEVFILYVCVLYVWVSELSASA